MNEPLLNENDPRKKFEDVIMSILEEAESHLIRVKEPKMYYELFFMMFSIDKLMNN